MINHWVYAPGHGAKFWNEFSELGIMGIGWDKLGDLSKYNSREEIAQKLKEFYNDGEEKIHDSLACYNFANDIKIGDFIIPKKGRRIYLGYGIVESDYFYDANRVEYKNVRKVKWVKKGEWNSNDLIVPKTLTKITQNDANQIKELIGISSFQEKEREKLPASKNLILYGPPGTGKTFSTKKFALSMMGELNE